MNKHYLFLFIFLHSTYYTGTLEQFVKYNIKKFDLGKYNILTNTRFRKIYTDLGTINNTL